MEVHVFGVAGSETRYQSKKSIVVWSGIRDPSQIVLAQATRSAHQHHDLSLVSEFQSRSVPLTKPHDGKVCGEEIDQPDQQLVTQCSGALSLIERAII